MWGGVGADQPLAELIRRFGSDAAEAGRVLIVTSHWALNFRDVLVAMGVIPSVVAGKALGIGGECVGVVAAVGGGLQSVDWRGGSFPRPCPLSGEGAGGGGGGGGDTQCAPRVACPPPHRPPPPPPRASGHGAVARRRGLSSG